MEHKKLPDFKMGQHGKRFSPLKIREVAQDVQKKILEIKTGFRSLPFLCHLINTKVIPDHMDGAEGRTTCRTLAKHMRQWGFKLATTGKNVYYDGHEREDVVKYRGEWAKRMMEYKRRMDVFTGDENHPIIPYTGKHKIVMVTHDECTFYANDVKKQLWLLPGVEETPLAQKGPGQSIMVSEFQCPYHKTMKSKKNPGKTSRELFYAGKNRDGWWTAADMRRQFKEVVEIFEELHEGCTGIFLFDNSSNHGAFEKSALVVSRMCMNTKKDAPCTIGENGDIIYNDDSKFYPFRDTLFGANNFII
jgi:hypothetical protein